MSSSADPLPSAPELPPEERARANLYALLARLLYAPPDEDLLAALAAAEEIVAEGDDAALALAWRELTLAAAATERDAAQREYDSVFVGTGRAEVTPYAGAYLPRAKAANPLIELRGFLAAHGLARRDQVNEPEDHVAALCDVMRHLVAEQRASLETQREFFNRFLWPAAHGYCDATIAAEHTRFYKSVARLAMCFLELEKRAFEIQ